jgi:hypothetical protein
MVPASFADDRSRDAPSIEPEPVFVVVLHASRNRMKWFGEVREPFGKIMARREINLPASR